MSIAAHLMRLRDPDTGAPLSGKTSHHHAVQLLGGGKRLRCHLPPAPLASGATAHDHAPPSLSRRHADERLLPEIGTFFIAGLGLSAPLPACTAVPLLQGRGAPRAAASEPASLWAWCPRHHRLALETGRSIGQPARAPSWGGALALLAPAGTAGLCTHARPLRPLPTSCAQAWTPPRTQWRGRCTC